MEAQAALVGADGAVHLDAEAAVDLDLAAVVDPGHAEHDHPLGLDDALEDLGLAVLGMLVEDRARRLDDLLDGLMEFRLARVLGHQLGHELADVVAHELPSNKAVWTATVYTGRETPPR